MWNSWRKQNPRPPVDMSESDLGGAKLRGALLAGVLLDYSNLSGADLTGADLHAADLSAANLTGAKLAGANLADALLGETVFFAADLRAANLCEARLKGGNLARAKLRAACLTRCDLQGANMSRADLCDTDMTGANLCETDLTGAKLHGADLRGATFIKTELTGTSFVAAHLGETVFAATSLRNTKALRWCRHHGPSSVDQLTLAASGTLPVSFLRGCGLSDGSITMLPAMQTSAGKFPLCFISHAARDAAFARRLHAELQARGIRCWLNSRTQVPDRQIAPASRLGDKVLLCCSRASLATAWLDDEIQQALMKEERLGGKNSALIPLDLDGSLRDPVLDAWKKQCLIARDGVDFNGWRRDEAKFNRPLRKLAGWLRARQG